jgi:hypothetical protein
MVASSFSSLAETESSTDHARSSSIVSLSLVVASQAVLLPGRPSGMSQQCRAGHRDLPAQFGTPFRLRKSSNFVPVLIDEKIYRMQQRLPHSDGVLLLVSVASAAAAAGDCRGMEPDGGGDSDDSFNRFLANATKVSHAQALNLPTAVAP